MFPGFGSVVEEVTKALLVRDVPPGEVTVTVIVTWAKPPAGMDPRLAVTLPVAPPAGEEQVP